MQEIKYAVSDNALRILEQIKSRTAELDDIQEELMSITNLLKTRKYYCKRRGIENDAKYLEQQQYANELRIERKKLKQQIKALKSDESVKNIEWVQIK